MLVHSGHVKLKAAPPKTPLLVSLRVSPAQPSYSGTAQTHTHAALPHRAPSSRCTAESMRRVRLQVATATASPHPFPCRTCRTGSDRNGIASREWSGAHSGVSYKVERCLQHTAGSTPPAELSMLRKLLKL